MGAFFARKMGFLHLKITDFRQRDLVPRCSASPSFLLKTASAYMLGGYKKRANGIRSSSARPL